ncbi:histidine--tRNA ligase [Sphingomonas ginsenosidimutans]|jgi:histidyl-tRNA synthetase|uniref:Histidine--tRNA ligase n=1 Tax=Sphingomonas ginsenosidimutans TaxID=862134 RepID=A0A2A4HVK7_9SPHN|nr:histidine--tRNA ligase [Sphingomonas ginsenosidimutans]MEE2916052.1 histidine--tRNA ligase [Pseudomonadota bacterium]PCG08922.1 histidine--tRNA ligase [Sphingomonas ginsenosidimutans]
MARIPTPGRVRGTQDIFREEQRRFARVLDAFDRVRRLYGFERVEVPVFEDTAVFARSIGETTDVVSKEMYTFPDKGGDSLTLRPEFTAGIARAYITNGWQQYAPVKLVTSGAVFRYERPQKGRYRQFHQIDAEVLGAPEPAADVELLTLADQLLHELGIADGVTLQLNTLGDAATRDAWRDALVAHFAAHRGELSEDSLARLDKNPLRILDSKDPRDRSIADAAPGIDAFMSAEAGAFFEAVQKGLDASGVRWTRNERLVRGLDYYRHTAFEFVTDRLGAQGTVLAGGRYDGLVESLGGPATAGVGWAAGIERLAMLIEEPAAERPDVSVIPEAPSAEQMATRIAANLRRSGFIVDLGFRGKAKKRFEEAAKVKSGGRVIVATEQFSGENAAGISVRANQDHELGDTHVEAILSALAKGFTIERSWENPRAGQIDAVVRPL